MSRRIGMIIPVLLQLALVCAGYDGARASVTVDEEEIIFGLADPEAQEVYVVGDFNGWNPTIDKLVEVDGRFEIRLYLLPGQYRYRFIVDGESIADPESPGRDENGNSFFVLIETQDGYEIALEKPGKGAGVESADLAPFVSCYISGGSYRDAALLMAGIDGAQGERVKGRVAVGWEIATRDFEDLDHEMFFIRGSGTYAFEMGRLTFFTREADLDLEDPLRLFNHVSPYKYPIGLFSRGVAYEGRLPLGIEGKAFYAGRLSGPEGAATMLPQDTLYMGREATDADMGGLALGSKLWMARVSYLMRRDRRPFGASWSVPAAEGALCTGYERVDIDGFMVQIPHEGPVTFEAEVLGGRSRLISRERSEPGEECCPVPFESDLEWERGTRFYSGLRCDLERFGGLLAIEETRIEGAAALRGGRADGHMTAFRAAFDLVLDSSYFGISGGIESYSSGNTGEVFWYARKNFFLDGDDLTVSHLPFIGAKRPYELFALFAWQREGHAAPNLPAESALKGRDGACVGRCRVTEPYSRIEDIHHGAPYQPDLTLSMLLRGDMAGSGDRFAEFRLAKGIGFRERFGLYVDMRYASYRIGAWEGTRDFLNAFATLYGKVLERGWIGVGVGIDPYLYDRWSYGFTGLGREDYLLDQDVMEAFGGGVTTAALEELREAERSLAEDWAITFEAYIGFW